MIIDLLHGPIVQAVGDVPHRAVLRVCLDHHEHVVEWIVHTQSLREDDTVDYGQGTYFGPGEFDAGSDPLSRALECFKERDQRLTAAPSAKPQEIVRFLHIARTINPG